jgi:polygalacturonase
MLQASGSKEPSARPFLLLCLRSTAVSIEGISLVNSSAWTMHVFQCSDLTISHIRIRSLGLANNDGIDIDSSQRVHVEGCAIETGDDAICLKTTSGKPCKDITVKGCTMTTRCAAFKIGTESAGDFSAIRVSDCHVVEASLGAIKILSVDGANIHDVLVERMQVDDADTPIFLRLGARGRTFRPRDVGRPPGTLSNVVIRNIDVKHACRIGILISGIPGRVIEDVTLD